MEVTTYRCTCLFHVHTSPTCIHNLLPSTFHTQITCTLFSTSCTPSPSPSPPHTLPDDRLDGYQKKKYVCKLLFIFLLGNDIDFGHQEAVNLLSSVRFSEKQIVSLERRKVSCDHVPHYLLNDTSWTLAVGNICDHTLVMFFKQICGRLPEVCVSMLYTTWRS